MARSRLRGWRWSLCLVPLLGGGVAVGQTSEPWIDPPEDLGKAGESRQPETSAYPPLPPPRQVDVAPEGGAIRQAAPTPAPSRSGIGALPETASGIEPTDHPATTAGVALPTPEKASQELAESYLETWSAPNQEALEGMARFYASTVRFHGRVMNASALMNEKRRFARRWPVREYRHRPGSMEVACNPAGTICNVRSAFDYTAASPGRGRRSSGAGTLELVISFAGELPAIIEERSETSRRSAENGNRERGRPR